MYKGRWDEKAPNGNDEKMIVQDGPEEREATFEKILAKLNDPEAWCGPYTYYGWSRKIGLERVIFRADGPPKGVGANLKPARAEVCRGYFEYGYYECLVDIPDDITADV